MKGSRRSRKSIGVCSGSNDDDNNCSNKGYVLWTRILQQLGARLGAGPLGKPERSREFESREFIFSLLLLHFACKGARGRTQPTRARVGQQLILLLPIGWLASSRVEPETASQWLFQRRLCEQPRSSVHCRRLLRDLEVFQLSLELGKLKSSLFCTSQAESFSMEESPEDLPRLKGRLSELRK